MRRRMPQTILNILNISYINKCFRHIRTDITNVSGQVFYDGAKITAMEKDPSAGYGIASRGPDLNS